MRTERTSRPYEGRLWSKATEVSRIDWTGFPFLLMRGGTLEKAGGRNAFLPILDESLPHGMSGEDIGWCKRAGAAGLILAADPRVRVDHLKLVSAEPYMPEDGGNGGTEMARAIGIQDA